MKKVLVCMLSVLAILGIVSCKSKPKAEEVVPEAPVVEEQAPVVEEEVPPVVEETQVDYTDVLNQIENARSLAIEAGAEAKASDLLKEIDAFYDSLKENGDLAANADELIRRYKSLANYIKAKDAKEKIDAFGFAGDAQREYDAGSAALTVVENTYSSQAPLSDDVANAAAEAYSNFNKVLIIGFKKIALQERVAAFDAKKKADSVKAGVSRKEQYGEAADKFQKADALYAMQSPEKAYENYKTAKETFTALFNDVSEKRAAAQAAIEAAKRKVAESANYAEEADAKAPITEAVEGIEEEDAVLLEETTYEDPDAAVIQIDATIEGQEEILALPEESTEVESSEGQEE